MIPVLAVGAPGVYEQPDVPLRALTGVRMDVCAFLGVAPRGPARVRVFRDTPWAQQAGGPRRERLRSVPVAVESWDEYLRHFGGFEGPGLLPYAVASFFEQGGRRAYVVRIVHAYDDVRDEEGTAVGVLVGIDPEGTPPGGGLRLFARNEGAWGNALRFTTTFEVKALVPIRASAQRLTLPHDATLPLGSLLRLTLPHGSRHLRFVTDVFEEWEPVDHVRARQAMLDAPLAADPEATEVVTATVTITEGAVDDGAPDVDRTEVFESLGLAPWHPRWLAKVLYEDSQLVYPDSEWGNSFLSLPDPALPTLSVSQFVDGADRHADITPDDFFDPRWVPGDDDAGDGVHALVELLDLSLVVAPDLYSAAPLPPTESVVEPQSLAGSTFTRCVELPPIPAQEQPPQELAGLRLDPASPADLSRIVGYQRELVRLADQLRSFVVLLDVPPRLSQRGIIEWRAHFGSEFAAAYHPWLEAAPSVERLLIDRRDRLIRLNPSPVAAGIIARQEHLFGVHYGPANAVADGIVNVADRVTAGRHDELHPLGINVFLRERDGVRLTAGRTLARRSEYRQLSVRRLVTMLIRTLGQQMQWTVFEPNGARLRAEVRHMLTSFLRKLFVANAFAGATEEEAFFVRCDENLNPRRVVDAGRLVTEVGIAPAEPLEFIVLRIARGADGVLRVEG